LAPRNVHADQWDIEGLSKYLVEQFGPGPGKTGRRCRAAQIVSELGDQILRN